MKSNFLIGYRFLVQAKINFEKS